MRLALYPHQIYSLKAAGNYIEITCEEQTYLKRATLKQLIVELPHDNFLQVHRSYAINVEKLIRITNTESGCGIASLSNQQDIPISKRFKPKLNVQATAATTSTPS